jgi:hypothetical protein
MTLKEDMAHEYAEALNNIADMLDMPTGSTPAEIVKMAGNRWARGIHTCHDQCTRQMCVIRRERDVAISALNALRACIIELEDRTAETLEEMEAREMREHVCAMNRDMTGKCFVCGSESHND